MNRCDADRVQLARQGDVTAFSELVELHWRRLVGLARSIVGESEAEDLVQEGLLIAWRKLHRLREAAAFPAWLTRIVARSCIRRARQRRTHVTLDAVGELAGADGRARQQAIHVQQMLAMLAPRQRAVMHCTVIEGMSDSEIGAALGITAGSVRSHRRRARERLQQVLPDGTQRGGAAPRRGRGGWCSDNDRRSANQKGRRVGVDSATSSG